MNPSSNMHRPTPPFGFITADNGETTQQNVKTWNKNWTRSEKWEICEYIVIPDKFYGTS